MITIENYKSAYNYGVNDSKNGEITGWFTPALEAAYDMGYRGIAIDFENVVIAERYGNLPEGGVSFNYSEGKKELGCSASNIKGEKEIGSSMWFADREKIEFSGILLPVTGSDGEPLVLPLEIEQYDF